ncbi:MAG: enoyl-CoA hydratase/isomerase family protein [Opitutus sp.]|nr:enoyl-CoA hydratase/isomerase family protein [Opitutus sp.]
MSIEIQLRRDGPLAEIILVPPEGRPVTINHEVLDRLDHQIAAIEAAGDAIRIVILRSASPKYFCVGADLHSLQYLNGETITPWIEHGHAVFDRLEKLPQPVVARVEGYALGGGLELALAADFIVASEQAQLGQTEARLGFITGWGGAWRLPRRVGAARAKELFFTGRIVPAAEAATLGLVNVCLPAAALDAWCAKLVQDVSVSSPIALREFKRLVSDAPTLTYDMKTSGEVQSSLDCVRSADTQQRVQAFLESRKKPAAKG